MLVLVFLLLAAAAASGLAAARAKKISGEEPSELTGPGRQVVSGRRDRGIERDRHLEKKDAAGLLPSHNAIELPYSELNSCSLELVDLSLHTQCNTRARPQPQLQSGVSHHSTCIEAAHAV